VKHHTNEQKQIRRFVR